MKGYHHPEIDDVKQYITEEIWDIMIRRTRFVHEHVQHNGNDSDKIFINNWPWVFHHNASRYINASAQERLLGFEEQYSGMLQFPADCTHQLLIPGLATSGTLLQQYFNDWNIARQNLVSR